MKRKFISDVRKVWGSEHWVVNDDYCGKILKLKRTFRCSLHLHKLKDETFLVLTGKVRFELSGKVIILNPTDIIDIPKKSLHRFSGLKDSVIVEFSTHHEDEDSYRVELSGKI